MKGGNRFPLSCVHFYTAPSYSSKGKGRKMIVDQEHGRRNCIIPQGSHLEESSINRAKHEEKYGRIISGIFHLDETKQNLWLSPYRRHFKAVVSIIHRVTLLLKNPNQPKKPPKLKTDLRFLPINCIYKPVSRGNQEQYECHYGKKYAPTTLLFYVFIWRGDQAPWCL